ncbi:ArnT family glycosyltransferase [Winogradskyella jejuensis]|uniref:Dolichyl-phosphate-mannose-protein mannosyltransferase n=1 Tax=Winogradskyella jejuensis TaxID=1089305 RepID=A0A1M5TAN9_9FLAO|nr:glycosyltransferase family 39 protein [Winogradskyella jejuensis]SHH47855.1 Dolichyl-phosphate-mannose-protein mannosyltransferase [Winogradskyella jejuensis]
MKKYLPIIFSLAAVKFIIQCIGNRNYGFHRDELLHLSVSEHMEWGFMEFPPFVAFIGKLSYLFFDYSLWGVRLFPTLAGVAILVLCCLIAKELGAKSKGIFLAGICVLAFIPFYRNHTLFQPVAFDQLFWTLGFYFLVKYINTKNKEYLLLLGLTLGLGLLNKYTVLVWAFGLFVGLFFYNKGRLFRNKWLYISGLLGLLVFLPNIIWQFQNDLPLLKHLQSLNEKQLDGSSSMDFLVEQFDVPFTFIISVIGLGALLFVKRFKDYRAIGVAVLITFVTLWILKSKAYYAFSIYPILFAAGAAQIEHLLSEKSAFVYAIAAFVFLPVIYFIPEATPLLPVETYVNYMGLEEKDGRYELTGDYADMFGWEEQVKLVDSVYKSLSPREQQNCVLWAENYGEAGALKILGKQYNLSNLISRHGSFWLWGYDDKDAEVWISLGNETSSVNSVFEDVQLVKMITHKYAISEENNIPLYICRKPKVDIPKWWADYKDHVFD